MNRARLLLLGALALGCRNLEYPEDPAAENKAPELSFVSPAEGARVPMRHTVAFQALDPNGIALLQVSCGSVQLLTFSAEPFEGEVNFAPCASLGDAGDAIRTIELSAFAVDRLGARSETVTRTLEIDTTVPSVIIQAPDRVAPRGRVEVIVRSTTPLAGPPSILLGGASALVTRTPSLEGNGIANAYVGVVDPAPGLGVDNWSGTGDVPIEVLEELERDVPLVVEARAENGNLSREDLIVKLSRVAWRRPLPGYFNASWGGASAPAATGDALYVPLEASSTSWLPGRFTHATGQFTPMDPGVLATDGGMSVRAMDALGRVYLENFQLTGYLLYDLGTGSVVAQGAETFGNTPRRVGERLCEEVAPQDCVTPERPHALRCVDPAGFTSVGPVNNQLDGGDDTWGLAGLVSESASTALLTSYQGCTTPSPRLAYLVDSATGTGRTVELGIPAADQMPNTAIPFGNGSFALMYQYDMGGGFFDDYETFILRPDGTRSSTPFFTDQTRLVLRGDPGASMYPDDVIAGRPDGTLVTLRRSGLETYLEAWSEGSKTPITVRLPGLWSKPFRSAGVMGKTGGAQPPGGAKLSAIDATGHLALALARYPQNPPLSYLVVVLDPQFRPLFVYRPPFGSEVDLHANDADSHLYVIDSTDQTVTALHR